MATTGKLRNVQFYRNGSPVTDKGTSKSLRDEAIRLITAELAKLKDGEIIIGRYTENSVTRSVLGIAYIDSTDTAKNHLEIIPDDDINDIIATLDATVTSDTTNVKVTVVEEDGKLTSVSVSEDYATISTSKSGDANTTFTVADGDTGKLVKASDLSTVASFANTRIDEEIKKLDVDAFSQASVIETEGTDINYNEIQINGISEADGKIATDTDKAVKFKVDGKYSTDNPLATVATVTNAIDKLDVESVDLVDTTETKVGGGDEHVKTTTYAIHGVTETDGKIGKTENATDTITVGDGRLYVKGSGETTVEGTERKIPEASSDLITSANTSDDATVILDSNTIVYDASTNTIKVRTKTSVTETNQIVTESDIATLDGAMHYKGTLSKDSTWPTTVKAGDTYIATGDTWKTTEGNVIEAGDMIVFGISETSTDYHIVETNITSGVNAGQYAKNTATLVDKEIVVADLSDSNNQGIKTSGVKIDAEVEDGKTTISSSSTNATLPTSKNVYDGIIANAVQTVTETTNVTAADGVVTVSDQLTVDDTAQTANTFKISTDAYSDAEKDTNKYQTNGVLTLGASTDKTTVTVNHGTIDTDAVNVSASDDSALSFSKGNLSKTVIIPSLKVDRYGHVYSETNTTYTITLPSTIDTAIQTIVGEDNAANMNNDEFVNVSATQDGTDKTKWTLDSKVKTQTIKESNPASDGKWEYQGFYPITSAETTVASDGTLAVEKDFVDNTSVKAAFNDATVITATNGVKYYVISEGKASAIKTFSLYSKFPYALKTVSGEVAKNDGLVTAIDAKEYIAGEIDKLDSTVTSKEASVATATIVEVNGVLTKVSVETNDAGVTYTAATTTDDAKLEATTTTGAITGGSDLTAIKNYIDAQAAVSNTSVSEGDGIDITKTTNDKGGADYKVTVDLASTSATVTTDDKGVKSTSASSADNLLVMLTENDDVKLSISDTWDCGTF